jgi:dimethylhistidine N-methyltransferase
MSSSYRILSQKDVEKGAGPEHKFCSDVLIGLSKTPKELSSRYFYDENGSRLFQKIMDLPEYYLTECEFNIFNTHKEEFSRLMGNENFNLIELGVGDGRKTFLLLNHFMEKGRSFRYIPIDISESSMKTLTQNVSHEFPDLTMEGIVAEYFDGLKWISQMGADRNLVLFLGSNLGNFNKKQSQVFLYNLWNALNKDDYVAIGFDLKKDIDLMLDAYNDSQGITSEFNLNLLHRINRELGGDFDLDKFRHYSSYDVFTGAMESYLVSLEKQTVYIKAIGQSFSFDAWEPIHTEYSYKYLESDIKELASETGYVIEKQLYDSKKYFADSIWRVEKIE